MYLAEVQYVYGKLYGGTCYLKLFRLVQPIKVLRIQLLELLILLCGCAINIQHLWSEKLLIHHL